jgi:chloramphenicol O-acetyltransferase type A
VEYPFCNPSYTVAAPDGTYRYCLVHADQPFSDYLAEAKKKQRAALLTSHLEEEGDVLGQLFISCVPWLSYDSLIMPWPDSSFSIPNFGWGKAVRDVRLVLENGVPAEKETVTLPVTVMVNHALMDGLHLSRFFDGLRQELDRFWTR